MYVELSVRGTELANEQQLKKGEFLVFCPRCTFALPKNTAMGGRCPGCGGPLHIIEERERTWDKE